MTEAHLPVMQLSLVQGFLSSQSTSTLQLPPQPMIGLYAHLPPLLSHTSMVHGSLSSHTTGVPPTQMPPWQTSTMVHEFESLHGNPPPLGELMQPPVAWLQVSVVQALPSSQTTGLPKHTPLLQVSLIVQLLLSTQAMPFNATCWHF